MSSQALCKQTYRRRLRRSRGAKTAARSRVVGRRDVRYRVPTTSSRVLERILDKFILREFD
jgi:hypothetical protein